MNETLHGVPRAMDIAGRNETVRPRYTAGVWIGGEEKMHECATDRASRAVLC